MREKEIIENVSIMKVMDNLNLIMINGITGVMVDIVEILLCKGLEHEIKFIILKFDNKFIVALINKLSLYHISIKKSRK